MQKLSALTLVLLMFTLGGCATALNSSQKGDLRSYQAKGLEVREKNPSTGAALGILPGGGSFYAREYGFGVINLLTWPLSIFWDPVSGYEGSQSINFYLTKSAAEKKLKQEMAALDDKLTLGVITKEQYIKEKHAVESMYQP
jgi:hypothetical protein